MPKSKGTTPKFKRDQLGWKGASTRTAYRNKSQIQTFPDRSRRCANPLSCGARRERPNWGLAQLMRPAEAAPAVPFVNSPLCQRPNICINNRHGILARWYHYKSSVPDLQYTFQTGLGPLSRFTERQPQRTSPTTVGTTSRNING
jgi:hypothetical protein